MDVSKTVTIRFFAILKEQAGTANETVQASCNTLHELYEDARRRHGFSLESRHLRVAVNGRFAEMTGPLADHDDVSFLPPVAGG